MLNWQKIENRLLYSNTVLNLYFHPGNKFVCNIQAVAVHSYLHGVAFCSDDFQ